MGGLLRHAMRGSVGVLAVLFCALCFVVPEKAFAADVPTASYDASTHEAAISHAGENGDLFANFKGLMPGDERDQDVNVQVGNARGTVRVYVQAFVDDASANLLEDVSAFGAQRRRRGCGRRLGRKRVFAAGSHCDIRQARRRNGALAFVGSRFDWQ